MPGTSPAARCSAPLAGAAPNMRSVDLANFDVVALIETSSPAAARQVQTTPAYGALMEAIQSKAKAVHIMAARNARRIGSYDTQRRKTKCWNDNVATGVV